MFTLQQKVAALLATEVQAGMMLRAAAHGLDAQQGTAGIALQDSNKHCSGIGA